jgi:hypothetical protein
MLFIPRHISSTMISGIRATSYYSRTPYAAPKNKHTATCTNLLPTLTKHLSLPYPVGRSLYQHTESSLHNIVWYLARYGGPQPSRAAFSKISHATTNITTGTAGYTFRSHCNFPDSLYHLSPLLCRG